MRFAAPHFHMPHFGSRSNAAAVHHHPHHPLYQRIGDAENLMGAIVGGLIVALLVVAVLYGVLSATGHPAYFDRLFHSS